MLRSLVSFLLFALPFAANAQCIDPVYHTTEELYDFIFDLQAAHPDWVKVDSIGHSRGDQVTGRVWPLYSVKISDNVNEFENEPVALIVMHIHAEEVIGLETTVRYMLELVDPPGRHATVRNNTQIYFVPTMNPDGLSVISTCIGNTCPDCIDPTWRKNGYIPPELEGDCNVEVGIGGELCGVDLNRNFELNWIYGDSLWKPTAAEPFDYYRGPGPFSEPEAIAVRDLALAIQPTVSIVYHSSRSGNIAEQSVVAWQWGDDPGPYKFPPDCTMIGNLNRRYIQYTDIHPGTRPFSHTWGGTHNGCLQDWFYWRLGTVQCLTETSPANTLIQPDSADLHQTIEDMIPSLRWIHRRLLNLDQDAPAPLAIRTFDAVSGLPISAEWRIVSTWTPLLPPRVTNSQWGRATILPPAGPITILARKEGYQDATGTASISPGGGTQTITINLQPLAWHDLHLQLINNGGAGLDGHVFVDGAFPRWVDVPAAGTTVSLPEGLYKVMCVSTGGSTVTAWREFWLGGDQNFSVLLPDASLEFSESFENGLVGWEGGGTQPNYWRIDADTSSLNLGYGVHTNPEGYRRTYPNSTNTWLRLTQLIDLTQGNAAHLEFFRRGRLDFPADSFLVEVSTDGNSWQFAAGFSDLELPWTRSFVNLTPFMGSQVYLRFRLVSDAALGDLGIHIDNVRVYTGTDVAAEPAPTPSPFSYRMIGAYPNPFNPSTEIHYEVATPGEFSIGIYNLLGQQVNRFVLNTQLAGPAVLRWNGNTSRGLDAPSGLYFARLEAGTHLSTLKLLLVR